MGSSQFAKVLVQGHTSVPVPPAIPVSEGEVTEGDWMCGPARRPSRRCCASATRANPAFAFGYYRGRRSW